MMMGPEPIIITFLISLRLGIQTLPTKAHQTRLPCPLRRGGCRRITPLRRQNLFRLSAGLHQSVFSQPIICSTTGCQVKIVFGRDGDFPRPAESPPGSSLMPAPTVGRTPGRQTRTDFAIMLAAAPGSMYILIFAQDVEVNRRYDRCREPAYSSDSAGRATYRPRSVAAK